MNSHILLARNTLWKSLVETTEKALRTGAQLPVPTAWDFIEDGGVRFFVRIIDALQRKHQAKQKQHETATAGSHANPFLPYDKDLFVADISESHVALLNKYNVVHHHLLIITRHFEDQETLLTLADFEALWVCMAEYNGLGFYNGGEAAGASQRHKHLQMIPLPVAPEGPETPIETLFPSARSGEPGSIASFPFRNAFVWLEPDIVHSPFSAARETHRLYAALLAQTGLVPPDTRYLRTQSAPYCLLISRTWMLLVPRSREFFGTISINSLGFAGALLVRDRDQMEFLKKNGPMNALRSVAIPL